MFRQMTSKADRAQCSTSTQTRANTAGRCLSVFPFGQPSGIVYTLSHPAINSTTIDLGCFAHPSMPNELRISYILY
ncbi:hypothetical protein CUZ56_02063 [Saezia sanguinis]|jgi:hypothetical protein|uniref:Uncharacterized protein n=1 Tax=Saezia sanguinis TaxID=1965230 RepID=A0A433SC59_9BURK|nr:hypothetical protein CUZ56_02063 [Saezia sanguinis]